MKDTTYTTNETGITFGVEKLVKVSKTKAKKAYGKVYVKKNASNIKKHVQSVTDAAGTTWSNHYYDAKIGACKDDAHGITTYTPCKHTIKQFADCFDIA